MKMNRILFSLSFLFLAQYVAKAQFVDVANPHDGAIEAYENRGDVLLLADKGDSINQYNNQVMLRWVNENGTLSFSTKYRNNGIFDTAFSIVSVSQSAEDVFVLARGPVAGVVRDRLLHYDTIGKIWSTPNGLNTYLDLNLVTARPRAIKTFDGALIVAGEMVNSNNYTEILAYYPNGDSVNVLAYVDSTVLGLEAHNGDLFAWGLFENTEFIQSGGLLQFPNAQTWQDPDPNDNTVRYKHVNWISSSEMIVQDENNNLFHKVNNSFVALPQLNETVYSSIRYADRLFVGMGDFLNRVFVYEDAIKDWVYVDSSDYNSTIHLEQVNNAMLQITLNSFFYRVRKFTRLGAILKTNLYLDLNSNCQRDANELGLAGVYIQEKNGNLGILTDPDGRSFQYVDPGLYEMDTLAGFSNYTRNGCSSDSVNITANADTVYYDVPMKLIDPNKTIEAYVQADIGFRARQGFTERYTIRVKNVGSSAKSCDYYVRIPEVFHLVSLSAPILDSIPKQYKISISLNPLEEKTLVLRCLTPVTATPLKWHAIYFTSDSSCNLEVAEWVNVQVRGAYDPNDKQSSEDALMPKETKKLRYHIRFQNTGTDTAYRVRIIDTIDRNLALNLIKVRTASHAHRVEVLHEPGSQFYALHFIFDNILLPDSNTDNLGSNGYIQYEASLRNGFSDKDTVFNTAHIFFDYQSAIITNTVENSFDTAGQTYIPPGKDFSHLITLYPNPSIGELHIRNNLGKPLNLMITDTRGGIVGYTHCAPLGSSTFNCQTLAINMYYVMSADKLIRKRFIVVKE